MCKQVKTPTVFNQYHTSLQPSSKFIIMS